MPKECSSNKLGMTGKNFIKVILLPPSLVALSFYIDSKDLTEEWSWRPISSVFGYSWYLHSRRFASFGIDCIKVPLTLSKYWFKYLIQNLVPRWRIFKNPFNLIARTKWSPFFASKERVPICGMPISKERAYKAINSSSFEKILLLPKESMLSWFS